MNKMVVGREPPDLDRVESRNSELSKCLVSQSNGMVKKGYTIGGKSKISSLLLGVDP